MKRKAHTEFFLNGEEVSQQVISARKPKKLINTEIIKRKYYEAPLNEAEKEAKIKRHENSSKFFKELRETREDMEKYHG